MRIFYSQVGDPMLLDTIKGMREFNKEFNTFVSSTAEKASFAAEINGEPDPYNEFLKGLRVEKTEGNARLLITEDKWLELRGSKTSIRELGSKLNIEKDGDHKHFYCSPVSLIIEVDESWPGWE